MSGALEDTVLPRLEGVRSQHGYYMARCPVHDDGRASLSVSEGRDHPVVFHCHAGCEPRAVVDALGLDWDALCTPRESRGEWTPRGESTAVYTYTDEHGQVLYEVLRTADKEFPVRVPDPSKKSGYRWSLKGVRRVLYRLPQVLAAAAEGAAVYVVEGEKDADRLARLGHAATCNPGGAGKWRPEYAPALAGAHVVVVADNDAPNAQTGRRPGWEHAQAVAASLAGAAASVRIVQAAAGKDASDHLAAGYGVGDLVPIDPGAAEPPEQESQDRPTESHRVPRDDETGAQSEDEPENPLVTARAAEIRAALLDSEGMDALPPPEPLIEGMLYLDSLAWLHGKPGHGKSFVALDWAAHVAHGMAWQGRATTEGAVLYLVAEGTSGVALRKQAWEATNGHRMGVTFLPMAVQMMSHTDTAAFAQVAAELKPAMVVIDTQARVTVGADENSSQDMGRFVAAADELRRATGACVLLVHHEARSGDTLRGSTAMEGAATSVIRATKDGSLIRLDNPKQKDAPPCDPIMLKLTPVDITHGGEQVQSAVVKSHGDRGTSDEMTASESQLLQTMWDSFGTTGASATNLRDVSGLPKSSFYRSINRLVKLGYLVNSGTQRQTYYVLANPPGESQVPLSPTQSQGPLVPSPKSHALYKRGTSGTNPHRDGRESKPEEPPPKLRAVGNHTVDARTGEVVTPALTPCRTAGCKSRIDPERYPDRRCEKHGGRYAPPRAEGAT